MRLKHVFKAMQSIVFEIITYRGLETKGNSSKIVFIEVNPSINFM
jgi:hypothetical protein